jgi:photosystem II stability/assembly factor-like uncharacterized protein
MAHRAKVGSPTGIVVTIISAVSLILLCTAAGASDVGQWTSTGGPWSERGNVQLLAVDAANKETAYAVIQASGLHTLYRTTDGAENWASVHTFQETVGSLAISDTVLYLGAMGVPPGQPAIWRSTDTGASWSPVYTAAVTTTVNALAMASDSTDHAYAALTTDDGGVMLETTTGTSWSEVLTNTGSFEAVAVDPSDSATAFAAGNLGSEGNRLAEIHRTTDAGATWSTVLTSTTEMFQEFLVIHPDTPEVVFAKTRVDSCCPPPNANLWRSTNGGTTWDTIANQPLNVTVFAWPDSIYGLSSGDRTRNASAPVPTWTMVTSDLPEMFAAEGAADGRVLSPSGDALLYLGFRVEGVYTSTDGLETMQAANNGFHNLLEPHAIVLDPQGDDTLYTVTDQDGFKSTDGGDNWEPMNLNTYYVEGPIYPLSFAVSPDDPDLVLMGAADESDGRRSIHRSTNGGVTWTTVYTNAGAMGLSEVAFGVAFDPTAPSRAYALSGPESPAEPVKTALLMSDDAGISWEFIDTYPGMYPGMSVLRVDPDGIVYVGGRTWEKDDPPVSTLIRSDDHADSWDVVYEGGDTLIRDLTFDPLNPDDVYMIEEYALLKSTDRGENWETILTSETALYSVLHDPTIPGRLYLGMKGPAILMSYDGGGSWVELKNWEDVLSAPQVMSLATSGDSLEQRTLYAGLDGVWKYVLTGTSSTIAPSEGRTVTVTPSEGVSTTIQVPPGAVNEETTLLYMPAVAPIDWLEPTGMRFAGQAFTLDAYVGGGHVEGYEFQQPVTVTIHYSDADVAGVDEGSLVLQLWEDGAWIDAAETCTPASTYVRDLEGNSLAVPICHLSYYALAGDPQYTLNVPLIMR